MNTIGFQITSPTDFLLSRFFRRRSKKTSKLRVTGLCVGNSPVAGEFPAQMASNAENVSIWWRHHEHDCLYHGFLPRHVITRQDMEYSLQAAHNLLWNKIWTYTILTGRNGTKCFHIFQVRVLYRSGPRQPSASHARSCLLLSGELFFLETSHPLQWRHNGHGGVSNHQPHQCLLNRLFGCRWKKTSKLRVTGLCVGMTSSWFPEQNGWHVADGMFSCIFHKENVGILISIFT